MEEHNPKGVQVQERRPESSTGQIPSLDYNTLLEKENKRQSHHAFGQARRPGTMALESIPDILMAIVAVYFLVFAILVYQHRDEPISDDIASALLEAAKYGPTIFPIVFAAIVTKFLRAWAALKMEHGSSVMTLEYILGSRGVFNALSAPLKLRVFHVLTPLLITLWALSPVGGQASLRVVTVAESYTNTTGNFTYLGFVSPLPNGGVGSAAAASLGPSNAGFTAALAGSANSKMATQDAFGNVKIPLLDSLPVTDQTNGSWRFVPDNSDVVWSSLAGIPVIGLSSSGVTNFTMSTGYMSTSCKVSGNHTKKAYMQSLDKPAWEWSGANYAIQSGVTPFTPVYFLFKSLAINTGAETVNQQLTTANCSVQMNYVDAQILCNGSVCRATAVRASPDPQTHRSKLEVTSLNNTQYTPLNGQGQNGTIWYTHFWANFVNATNPSAACDTSFCSTSAIEGYLADPLSPYYSTTGSPLLWKVDPTLFSHRFTQLLNTYWLDSIAPYAIGGNFTLQQDPASIQYNTDSSIGTISTPVQIMRVHNSWLAVLFIASLVMILSGIAGTALNMFRKGPEILDSFTSLLRDNQYARVPTRPSLEDSVVLARRWKKLKVRFGDVRPEEDVGYVALGTIESADDVRKLDGRRLYA